MTPDQSRAMALWMQTLPPDRRFDVQHQLAIGGIDPWLLLTPEEHTAALAALAEQRRAFSAPEAPSASEITEVSLSRGMCLGECPVYRVTLSIDGLVDYEGEAFVERIGQHQGEIDPDRVSDLIRVIMELGNAEPDPEAPLPLTDQPSAEIVLTSEQQSYRFTDDGGAPFEFWAMAVLVDAVIDEVEWDADIDSDDDVGSIEDSRADSIG
jgi:hypothetical protein